MDKLLPQTLPEGSSFDEREMFERWHADHRNVRSIILTSMSNDIQKQYDRLDDVASILQHMKEVYAIPDRHTRYVATKEFFRTKMTEGSSVQEHRVKKLSLVEKLEDLKVGFNNDTYIDVILQSLPPSYDPFIFNFNMNGFEKSINELINILAQYEATTKNCGAHICNDLQVLQRSKKLSKDEVVLRLGHISQDRIKTLVDSKSLEIDNLDNLPAFSQWTAPGTPQLNDLADRRNQTLLDMVRSMMSFTELPLSFLGYALEMMARLLNIAPSKSVAKTPYQIWHDKPASYKYLRVCGSPAYVKRLVGDKLRSRSSLCKFIGYLNETVGYYFYDPSGQKLFVSRNAVFLERGFPADTRCDELLLEESSEAPQSNGGASSAPIASTDNVPVLHMSVRVPQPPKRYGFLGVTGQLDSDTKTYGEAMLDINSGKWLEAMKFEMDSMSSNQVWMLVDRPKGVKPIGCKWIYKRKIGADGEVTIFKARLVAK
ncbi:UNVERIFIED_CONTAM: hypothetical protein Sradi_2043900 [Sesamum radiatum]|uniref:Uncharacterized protein n=1 Tax=Sesamum radiatum TaxID=300843 RepID=A0AAW2TH12_SESRA